MNARAYEFAAELWRWSSEKASWHFLTVPDDVSDDIEARTEDERRGFGSVRVRVTIGSSTWSTSVFPDASRAAYVLPVKKAVREREGLAEADRVAVTLELVEDER